MLLYKNVTFTILMQHQIFVRIFQTHLPVTTDIQEHHLDIQDKSVCESAPQFR